mgnify:CR=1 FL=1
MTKPTDIFIRDRPLKSIFHYATHLRRRVVGHPRQSLYRVWHIESPPFSLLDKKRTARKLPFYKDDFYERSINLLNCLVEADVLDTLVSAFLAYAWKTGTPAESA